MKDIVTLKRILAPVGGLVLAACSVLLLAPSAQAAQQQRQIDLSSASLFDCIQIHYDTGPKKGTSLSFTQGDLPAKQTTVTLWAEVGDFLTIKVTDGEPLGEQCSGTVLGRTEVVIPERGKAQAHLS